MECFRRESADFGGGRKERGRSGVAEDGVEDEREREMKSCFLSSPTNNSTVEAETRIYRGCAESYAYTEKRVHAKSRAAEPNFIRPDR